MLTYADVCWQMLSTARTWRAGVPVCWRMLTYGVPVCWRMLTYADVCWQMLSTARTWRATPCTAPCRDTRASGDRFTCFTRIRVHILTPEGLLLQWRPCQLILLVLRVQKYASWQLRRYKSANTDLRSCCFSAVRVNMLSLLALLVQKYTYWRLRSCCFSAGRVNNRYVYIPIDEMCDPNLKV